MRTPVGEANDALGGPVRGGQARGRRGVAGDRGGQRRGLLSSHVPHRKNLQPPGRGGCAVGTHKGSRDAECPNNAEEIP